MSVVTSSTEQAGEPSQEGPSPFWRPGEWYALPGNRPGVPQEEPRWPQVKERPAPRWQRWEGFDHARAGRSWLWSAWCVGAKPDRRGDRRVAFQATGPHAHHRDGFGRGQARPAEHVTHGLRSLASREAQGQHRDSAPCFPTCQKLRSDKEEKKLTHAGTHQRWQELTGHASMDSPYRRLRGK
jgi:hypothetical protein